MMWEPQALKRARNGVPKPGPGSTGHIAPEWVNALALVGIGEALCVIADDLNRLRHAVEEHVSPESDHSTTALDDLHVEQSRRGET